MGRVLDIAMIHPDPANGQVDQWVQTEALGWKDAPYVNMSISGAAINRTLGVAVGGRGWPGGPSEAHASL